MVEYRPAEPTSCFVPCEQKTGEPVYRAATITITSVQTPTPTKVKVKSENDKSDVNSEYWRNIYDQRLRVIIDAHIYIPLTTKMDWSSLSYRDKAEKLFELVAFGRGANSSLEREAAVTSARNETVSDYRVWIWTCADRDKQSG